MSSWCGEGTSNYVHRHIGRRTTEAVVEAGEEQIGGVEFPEPDLTHRFILCNNGDSGNL